MITLLFYTKNNKSRNHHLYARLLLIIYFLFLFLISNKHVFKSNAEAALPLVDYLENYYNVKRIHSSLGYKAQDEFLLSQWTGYTKVDTFPV